MRAILALVRGVLAVVAVFLWLLALAWVARVLLALGRDEPYLGGGVALVIDLIAIPLVFVLLGRWAWRSRKPGAPK